KARPRGTSHGLTKWGKEARPMHVWKAWPVRIVLLALGVFAVLALGRGQEQQSAAPQDKSKSKTPTRLAQRLIGQATPDKRPHDFSNLPPLQKQIWLSAQRGAEWLYRANGPDGRFAYGVVPALRTALEGDHYLRQASAAGALARVARFSGDQRYAARATQAIVALLTDTSEDARDPQVRYAAFPPATVNRLAAAGLLVAAIHELPEPDESLLAKSEQLCNYIRSQQQSDGSLCLGESPSAGPTVPVATDAAESYAGEALHGVARSIHHRPAQWKMELVRNALVFYKGSWRQ